MWSIILIPLVTIAYVGAILWGLWLLLSSNAMLLTGSGSEEDRRIALIMDISICALWLFDRYRSTRRRTSRKKDLPK